MIMKEKKKYKIYCDMDGVITDFIRGYRELTGIDITGTHHDSEDFWDPIQKAGYDFWINLKWKPDGKKLWNYIKKYEPEILSSPSEDIESRIGKYDWVKRELPNTRLILRSSEHKKEFAGENKILIDDRESNKKKWEDVGGIGILHKTTDETIKKLKELSL